jgi:hypothetical protein
MKRLSFFMVVLNLLLLISALPLKAQTVVPTELGKWSDWVLKDEQEHYCLPSINSSSHRICTWPKKLSLEVGRSSGNFRGEWFLYKDDFVSLPGSQGKAWPVSVKVNGKETPVVNENGTPQIFLKKGSYQIQGSLSWNKPPLRLALPSGVGLLSLKINGKTVSEPTFDEQGGLWLKRERTAKGKEKDFLRIKIFRKIMDTIPSTVETYLRLHVGGAERELTLPSLLLKDMVPMASNSNLPIQWNPNGQLKVRVKPGKWFVSLKSRGSLPWSSVQPPSKKSPFPKEEFWVFVAKNNLRVVDVTGVNQIDSQRLELPQGFQGLPTYLVGEGVTVNFEQKSRGLGFVSDNKLKLNRTLWLDFEGSHFTVQDQINGTMRKDWRLEMYNPFSLGSVKIGNQNQLITINGQKDSRGVEVRSGNISLVAESRLKKEGMILPAIGWNQSFENAQGNLHVPPGWRTLALVGPDYSRGTWLSKWSLLSLFFVLIMGIGVFKLKGFGWSAVTFFGLTLLIHEPDAPHWVWFHLLVALGLEKALESLNGQDKFLKVVKGYRWVSLAVLFIISFPFIVNQIQMSIYPSLEKQTQYGSFYSNIGRGAPGNWAPRKVKALGRGKGKADFSVAKKAMAPKMEQEAMDIDDLAVQSNVGGSSYGGFKSNVIRQDLQQFDPNAQIQTGPGIPKWSWGNITFGWEGPVDKGQQLRLIAISPILNRLLTLARLVLLILMAACFLDLKNSSGNSPWNGMKTFFSKGTVTSFIILLVSGAIFIPNAKADDYPNEKLLGELREYLKKPHDCYPKCGSVERMSLNYDKNSLSLRQKVHMVKEGHFILPGSREQWLPEEITVDGGSNFQLRGDGDRLVIGLSKGIHEILMKGKIPPRQQIQISVYQKPALFSHRGTGWSLEGLDVQGLISGALTLSRLSQEKGKTTEFKSTLLPQFLSVKRTFNLGVNWQVTTVVTRMTPSTQALNLEIPKLKGETVTSSNVVEEKNSVKISLSKNQRQMVYQSLLQESSPIRLQASEGNMWVETWQFIPGPIWRVQFNPESEGLEKISLTSQGNNLSPLYRPWPGEKLDVIISRPEGAKGETITLADSTITMTPGKRTSNYQLDLQFKTSIGLTHTIEIPKESQLQEVKIKGVVQSLKLKDGKLNLPLGVGEQNVSVRWQMPSGIASKFKSPKVNLGLKGINLKLKVKVPRDRWILAVGGPIMGPAVLFWGKLLALFVLGFLLSKISWCPLSFLNWSVLFLGLTQGANAGILWVTGYLIFLSFRKMTFKNYSKAVYNLTSIMALFGGLVSVGNFINILRNGLLGGPLMSIEGNDSSSTVLNWFVDRYDVILPDVWVLSLPTFAYQVLMLLWAIWMTFTLIKWVPWMWEGLYGEGFFKSIGFKIPKKTFTKKNENDNK